MIAETPSNEHGAVADGRQIPIVLSIPDEDWHKGRGVARLSVGASQVGRERRWDCNSTGTQGETDLAAAVRPSHRRTRRCDAEITGMRLHTVQNLTVRLRHHEQIGRFPIPYEYPAFISAR